MSEHRMALVAIWSGIVVMCECGWHAAFLEVTDFDHVAQLVKGHRDAG